MLKRLLFIVTLVLVGLLAGCQSATEPPTAAPTEAAQPTEEAQPAAASGTEIILATTTSTQDSGVLDVLVPVFQDKSGITVKTVAVGSGEALKMGEEGNADVLLVHSPAAEATFMENGYGSSRTLVMHNDFIIVGPEADPAGIKGTALAVDAMKKIADTAAPFISRGDDSGTHKMELGLWKKAELTPEGDWYQESGQGMGATLKIASEKAAYTITDRATYLANKDILALSILVEGDAALLNIYHVITVDAERWPKVNVAGAKAFADFLVSPEGQELIGQFGTEKFGQPLFTPDAGKNEADLGSK
jgi:tungstate transport system substrate-binding protein